MFLLAHYFFVHGIFFAHEFHEPLLCVLMATDQVAIIPVGRD